MDIVRLIDANKLFNDIENREDMNNVEKIKFLTAVSEQETALSITDLMIKIGALDGVAVDGKFYVNLKDVLQIITRKQ